MTKNEVRDIIRERAMEYGFEVGKMDGWNGFPDIISEELNFFFITEPTENTDWRAGILEQTLTITASVRRMGGHPTAEELWKTAEEIRHGAELMLALQKENLTWREEIK